MEFKNVLFEKRGSIAFITLNNPEKRNPINIDTHRELRECFDMCDYDDEIRAVVIRGAGGNFSAGGDIRAMKARIDAGIRGTRAVCRIGAETNLRLLNVKKPVIAWIEGAITGAGISLALSCDFQIISETSKCAFSFVNIGFVPDSGAAYLVTRTLGTTKAKELMMSGRFFSGREAADWGLFTEAVPAEELEAAQGAIRRLGGRYSQTRAFHLPGGDARSLVVVQKISQTPTAYPRNGGKIAKAPLK